jgi:hypothetical protein
MSDSPWAEHWDYTASEVVEGDLAPARQPLSITSPRPDSERSFDSFYSYAHSQVEYRVPVRVFAGRAPFRFDVTGPAGIQIIPKAPVENPKMTTWAEVTMPAGVSGQYTVTVTDHDNVVETVQVTVVQDDSKFIFCDADAPGGGDGSFLSPFTGFAEMGFGDLSDTTHAGKIVYFQGGKTYPLVQNATDPDGGPTMEYRLHKPRAFLGMPGTGKWKADFTAAPFGWRQRDSNGVSMSNIPDFALHQCEMQNGYMGIFMTYLFSRASFWEIDCHDFNSDLIPEGGTGEAHQISNISCVASLVATTGQPYMGFTDIRVWNATGKGTSRNNAAAIMTYGGFHTTVDYIRNLNSADGGGIFAWPTLVFLKGSMHSSCITSCFAWGEDYKPHRGAHYCISAAKARDFNDDPDGYRYSKTVGFITRYSLFGATTNSGESLSFSYWAADPVKDLIYGKRYVDRCVLVGIMQKFPPNFEDNGRYHESPENDGVPRTGGVRIGSTAFFALETWRDYLIQSEVIIEPDTFLLNASQEDTTPYLNSDGTLKGDLKYKIGWEIQ